MSARAIDTRTILTGAVLIGIAYIVWKSLSKVAAVADSAAAAVASPIANAYVSLTSNDPATPTGSVIFPDGSFIAVASIQPTWVGNSLQFVYGGKTYALSSHDANGNYPATVAS